MQLNVTMGRKSSQADKHPTEELLGSSSSTSRSDNWGENVERNHASFLFQKRNGIEVVPCQDVEVVPYPYDEDRKDDVKEAKRAAVKSAQRKRLALQIIFIFIIVVILLFGGFWMGDYEGQRLSELIFYWLIIGFGGVGW